jgi:GH25 family lysozyme M1 (1,4-beta-N-acetylmuramidase)
MGDIPVCDFIGCRLGIGWVMNFIPLKTIPDISFWQDKNTTARGVDFVQMKKQVDGVIIRAGQNTWADEDFAYNWQAAKAAGLKRGSYWFYDSRSTPQQQADIWRSKIGNDLPELGLWIDLEESYGGAYGGETNWQKFAELIKSYFRNTPIGIYTANWWWQSQAVLMPLYWGTFPLWVSQYTSSPLYVTLPAPWRNIGAVLWQYTATGDGALYGVESAEIDLNYTSQKFHDLFGAVTPPPIGENKMQTWTLTATTTSLKIHGVLDSVSGWIHIDHLTRAAGNIDVIDGWCSGNVAYVQLIAEPPPANHTVEVIVDGVSVYKTVLS